MVGEVFDAAKAERGGPCDGSQRQLGRCGPAGSWPAPSAERIVLKSAHVLVEDLADGQRVLGDLRALLRDRFAMEDVTIQLGDLCLSCGGRQMRCAMTLRAPTAATAYVRLLESGKSHSLALRSYYCRSRTVVSLAVSQAVYEGFWARKRPAAVKRDVVNPDVPRYCTRTKPAFVINST